MASAKNEGNGAAMGNKLFMTTEDIAADLGIDEREAGRLVRNLGDRIKRKGGWYIAGMVPMPYYQNDEGHGIHVSGIGSSLSERKKICSCGRHIAPYSRFDGLTIFLLID